MDKKELMNYLGDAYKLEKQLYALNKIKEQYEDTYEKLELDKFEPLYVEEKFDGTYKKGNRTAVNGTALDDGMIMTDDEYFVTTYEEFRETGNIFNPYGANCTDYSEYIYYLPIKTHRKNWNTPEYKKLLQDREQTIKKLESSRSQLKTTRVCLIIIPLILLTIFCKSIVVGILGAIVGLIISIILNGLTVNPLTSSIYKTREAIDNYLKECYKKDWSLKKEFYQEKIEMVSKEYKEIILTDILETEKVLETLYAHDFIHPKYRNLIAVGQIYEYLDTNRCDCLEGAHGAYNLFESELRQNIIIMELNIVIEKLDEIKSAMYYVASAIKESNSILSNISTQLTNMSTSLSQISDNTALTAYNTQCISFNAELMRRYS